MSYQRRPLPRLVRILLITLASLLSIALVWTLGSHWLLGSQWLPKRLSQIDGIEVRWSTASSRYPGRLAITDLYIARDDPALPMTIDAERATLSLSLLALMRGELAIQTLEASHIRRLTLGDIALQAEGTLQIEDTVLSRKTLAVPHFALAVRQGHLKRLSDRAVLVNDLDLSAQGSLGGVSLSGTSQKATPGTLLDHLDMALDINARADAWDVFMPYLSGLPWLSLEGSGALTGALSLKDGILQPSSHLELVTPDLQVTLDEQRLSRQLDQSPIWLTVDEAPMRHTANGHGNISVAVDANQIHLITRLTEVSLNDEATAAPSAYAQNARLELATQVANQRLDHIATPTDARLGLSGDISRLDILDRYLRSYRNGSDMSLSGHGQVAVSATVHNNQLRQAELSVEAAALAAQWGDLATQGNGTLSAHLSSEGQLDLTLALHEAALQHHQRQLLTGGTLTLDAKSPLDPESAASQASGNLRWHAARLPDIHALQAYLTPLMPQPSPFTLASGEASSQGELTITPQGISGHVEIGGERLTTRWANADQPRTLNGQAHLHLNLRQATLDGTHIDIGGTQLRWQVADSQHQEAALASQLRLSEGRFERQGSQPNGTFDLEGSVQRLDFLNAFLPQLHGLSLSGSGLLFAEGAFEGGQLLAPTRLRINAEELNVGFMGYLASGRGELTAQLTHPDQAQLTLGIPRFALTQQGDDRPYLEGRHFALTTQTEHFGSVFQTPRAEDFTTRIALPITAVPDLARYNRYLPDDAGLELLGGQANLTSEWQLEGLKAQGALTLRAFGAELGLLDQRLRGDIEFHLALSEGDLTTRRFTADHSFLRLENVFRQSQEGQQDAGWWMQLDMEEAMLEWQDPIRLESQLGLAMRDTGLLARLFLARARHSDWLGRLLDVHNIAGSADLTLDDTGIRLHDLTLTGGPLLLLADVTLASHHANGALYATLGALGLAVELVDSEPTLRVVTPRRWFERWRARRPSS